MHSEAIRALGEAEAGSDSGVEFYDSSLEVQDPVTASMTEVSYGEDDMAAAPDNSRQKGLPNKPFRDSPLKLKYILSARLRLEIVQLLVLAGKAKRGTGSMASAFAEILAHPGPANKQQSTPILLVKPRQCFS